MGISAIGVSRRIAKFEISMGTKLLDRKPTRPTKAGNALCHYAESVEALEDKLMADRLTTGLQNANSAGVLKIAIAEQALSDWFYTVVLEYTASSSCTLEITAAGPDDAFELLRTGEVVAGLSHTKDPIHGFKSHHLGQMRYVAVASPAFVAQHCADGIALDTLGAAPALRHSTRDRLLVDWIEEGMGTPTTLAPQCLPGSEAILRACLRGTAWALVPASSAQSHITDGTLIDIAPDHPCRRDLYWHVASALAPHLAGLTAAIRRAVKAVG